MEEFEEGLNAVAAPVRQADGRVIAALGVSGPAFRMHAVDVPRLGALTAEAAERGIAPTRLPRTWQGRRMRRERRHDDRVGPGRAAVDSMLEAVGETPLVRLRRVAPDIELFAKVEWYGPTGSVKDRIYAHMLAKAEAEGRLRAGMTIIECTTGNAGIACAAVAAIKGYACTIVMPEGMSPERRRDDRGLRRAARAHAGRRHRHRPGARARCAGSSPRIPTRYFFPAEFENPDNPEAQEASGQEIWEQIGRPGRRGRRRAGDRRVDHRRHARAQGARARGASRTRSSPPSVR